MAALVVGCAQILGCASAIHNDPINTQLTASPQQEAAELGVNTRPTLDDTVVAVTFSGGGTRAAAFSYGVLQGFDEMRVDDGGRAMSLLDQLDFVSGVSGGSVLAAYYGLKKRAAMADFEAAFLASPMARKALQTDLKRPQSGERVERRHQRDYRGIPALARTPICSAARRSRT